MVEHMREMGLSLARPWYVQWAWDPVFLISLLVIAGLYLYAIGPYRAAAHPQERVSRGQIVAFASGILILFIALISPINTLSMFLFSGHMTQHLLVSLVVSPLLVVSIPGWLAQAIFNGKFMRFAWKWLTFPFIAPVLFNANIWIWHAPPILNAMMQNHALHAIAQACYLLTGVIFWWPLFGASVARAYKLNILEKMLYILLSDMPMVVIGAGLTFMQPLYDVYKRNPLGIAPSVDQQIGGSVMWIPGAIFMIVMASILFLRWMLQLEARQKETDARLATMEEEYEDEEYEDTPFSHQQG
ncbi:cytochrome c oxidase assembly protein [Ktedonospora formicarum]|uniref:Membrane protein n=1 Tax=Ktedonospora formicarum TaxID=2778364 RepID=A0A8J3MVQ2_9CHLR|nr:cytochrome c oxidase assembly protein [Ktedonospora formicarum]GHO47893.1 membrane protein [Ktedonospora formicarum]